MKLHNVDVFIIVGYFFALPRLLLAQPAPSPSLCNSPFGARVPGRERLCTTVAQPHAPPALGQSG